MMRTYWCSLASVLAVSGAVLGMTAAASARDLTFVSFGGSAGQVMNEKMVDPYEKKTGIKINKEAYDGGIAQMQVMVDSKNVVWDLVDVEGQDLYRGCQEGLYETFDAKTVVDTSDLIPTALGSDCGVAFSAWSTVLAYNSDKVRQPPKNWADFFDLQKYPGKRGLRNGPQFSLEIALMADGVAPADVYKVLSTPEGVDRAFKKLDTIKPSIQWWSAGAQPPQWLAAGDVILSAAYNGRIAIAHKDGQPLAHIWDGQIYTYDYFVIPKGTPKKEEAFAFMKWMLSPEPNAEKSKFVPYGPTSKKAMAMLDPKVVETFSTAPQNLTAAVPTDNQFWADNMEELTQRFNAWATK